MIFRDCHARNNITVPLTDSYVERFYRNFARRMGWPCCIRRSEAQAVPYGQGLHEAAMRFAQNLTAIARKGGAL